MVPYLLTANMLFALDYFQELFIFSVWLQKFNLLKELNHLSN